MTNEMQKDEAAREMLRVLTKLVSWANYTGGWENPAWEDARKAIKTAKRAGITQTWRVAS